LTGQTSSKSGSERDILAKLQILWMRRVWALLALLVMASLARAQTLASMGAMPTVYAPLTEKNVAIPFEFTGICTPFLELHLVSGVASVYYDGRKIFTAKQPGWYRVLLPTKKGAVTLQIKRRSYEDSAAVDPEGSFVACARVPIVDINATVPKLWKKGGYTDIYIKLRNTGTAPAKIYIKISDPRTSAHLPTREITVAPRSQIIERVRMVTARETNRALLLPICVEYKDQYGEQEACTDFYEFRADKNVAITLIKLGGTYILMNSGTEEVNLGSPLNPGDIAVTHLRPELRDAYVERYIELPATPMAKVSDRSGIEGFIMGVLGILSLLLSSKTL